MQVLTWNSRSYLSYEVNWECKRHVGYQSIFAHFNRTSAIYSHFDVAMEKVCWLTSNKVLCVMATSHRKASRKHDHILRHERLFSEIIFVMTITRASPKPNWKKKLIFSICGVIIREWFPMTARKRTLVLTLALTPPSRWRVKWIYSRCDYRSTE